MTPTPPTYLSVCPPPQILTPASHLASLHLSLLHPVILLTKWIHLSSHHQGRGSLLPGSPFQGLNGLDDRQLILRILFVMLSLLMTPCPLHSRKLLQILYISFLILSLMISFLLIIGRSWLPLPLMMSLPVFAKRLVTLVGMRL